MAILTLVPTIKLPDGEFSTNYQPTYTLEGLRYGFRFYRVAGIWMQPDQDQWNMDIFDPDSQQDILLGIRLVVGINLLAYYQYKNVPPGILCVADLHTTKWDKESQSFINIRGYDPLGDDFANGLYSLVYVTSDEFS